jgi:hypothetical protein
MPGRAVRSVKVVVWIGMSVSRMGLTAGDSRRYTTYPKRSGSLLVFQINPMAPAAGTATSPLGGAGGVRSMGVADASLEVALSRHGGRSPAALRTT